MVTLGGSHVAVTPAYLIDGFNLEYGIAPGTGEMLCPRYCGKDQCFLWKLKHPEEEKGKQENLSGRA